MFKNRPQALEKPRAFHAFDDHFKLMRAKFSGTPLREDLSLFPTSSGDTAVKAQVVKLIEAIASSLRLPWVTVEGKNIYGGH